MKHLVVSAILSLSACASDGRFKVEDPVWRVDDARDIAPPAEREFHKFSYFGDRLVFDPALRALSLPDLEVARDTNSLDEVPDSTWFTNRIGVRHLSPAAVARGNGGDGPPVAPLTVVGGKSGGGNPGFTIKDARGHIYLVKFDTLENPGMQALASLVVNRILWAAGYNVPNDTVFTFDRNALAIASDAHAKDDEGHETKFDRATLDGILAFVPARADGLFDASASEFLSGKPMGGFPLSGRRDDDPNDRIDHQHRRVLRGLRVLAAWVNHTDLKEDNTLDMYVDEGGKKFLRHYLVDFGEALASHAAEKGRREDGFEYVFDWEKQGRALASFGLWQRHWESIKDTGWLSIGGFESQSFDPALWREAYPFPPFQEMDAADAYWGAKLVLAFDREHLEAIVAEAHLPDPAAAAYLVQVLMERRKKIGLTWLEAVTPLDDLVVEHGELCGRDLGVVYGLSNGGRLERVDAGGVVKEVRTVSQSGDVCMSLPSEPGYQVMRLRIARGRFTKPVMQVHVKAGRVLGLNRLEP